MLEAAHDSDKYCLQRTAHGPLLEILKMLCLYWKTIRKLVFSNNTKTHFFQLEVYRTDGLQHLIVIES